MSRNHYHSTPAKRHVGLWNFHHVTSMESHPEPPPRSTKCVAVVAACRWSIMCLGRSICGHPLLSPFSLGCQEHPTYVTYPMLLSIHMCANYNASILYIIYIYTYINIYTYMYIYIYICIYIYTYIYIYIYILQVEQLVEALLTLMIDVDRLY